MTDHSDQSVHPSKLYTMLGADTFDRLIAAFYRRVANDATLRLMYPEHDLEGAERRLRLFVIQFFGGPAHYRTERGQPRLRMRHMPFPIGKEARDAWMNAMTGAMDEVGIPDPAYTVMHTYFASAATFMVNHPLGGLIAEGTPPQP